MKQLNHYRLGNSEEVIYLVQFSAHSPHLVAVCSNAFVLTFQLGDALCCVGRFNTGYRGIYSNNTCHALHPEKNWLAVAAAWSEVGVTSMPLRVFSWPEGKIEHEYMVEDDGNQAICFSPDGQWLVSATSEGIYYCISLERDRIEWHFPTDEVNCSVCFHPDNKTVMNSYYRADWQWGSSIDFWEMGSQMLPAGKQPEAEWQRLWSEVKERGQMLLLYNYLQGACFSPDGNLIGVSHYHAALYSYPDKQFLKAFDLEGNCVEKSFGDMYFDRKKLWTKIVFTPDSQTMLCGSPDGTVFHWNVQSGEIVDKVKAHEGRIYDIALSADGQTLASCGEDGTLKLWQIEG